MNRTSGEPSHWELKHSSEFGDFNDGAAQDLRSAASGSSTCSSPVAVTGGEIYWRGVWQSRDAATRLRDEFASQTDWSGAQQFAADLTAALNKTAKEHA